MRIINYSTRADNLSFHKVSRLTSQPIKNNSLVYDQYLVVVVNEFDLFTNIKENKPHSDLTMSIIVM